MANDNEFVKERLDALKDDGFQPNVANAGVRLRAHDLPKSKGWVWSAVAVAAVLAIAAALPSGRVSAQNPATNEWSLRDAVHHIHDMIYAHYRAWTGAPPIRTLAYDFSLKDATGKTVRLSDYRGTVVLLNFWATWCAPCKTEVPWFVELQKKYEGDLVVLGVSMDEDGWKSVKPFVEARKVNYPVMLASPELPEVYREIEQLPKTFLIDRSGRIADQFGAVNNPKAFEDWLKKSF